MAAESAALELAKYVARIDSSFALAALERTFSTTMVVLCIGRN